MRASRNLFALVLPCVAALFTACASPPAPEAAVPPAGPWSDSTALTVLDAQDHRDAQRLITLLSSGSAVVREQAALSLASVGDSSAASALLKALSDDDPVVRCNAAFAFGLCGDSVNVHRLIERYSSETNTAVRGRIAEAMGRIGGADIVPLLLRRGRATHMDTLGVLLGLYRAALNKHSDTGAVRCALGVRPNMDPDLQTIANNVLLRSDAAALRVFTRRITERAKATTATEPLIPLIGALAKTGDIGGAGWMNGPATQHPDPRVRVAALRGLGKYGQDVMEDAVWAGLDNSDASVRSTAVELLQQWPGLDGDRLWKVAQEHADHATKIQLYALVMKHASAETRGVCGSLLSAMAQQDLGPYLNAELVKARFTRYEDLDTLRTIMLGHAQAVVRQAAFEQWVACFGDHLKNTEVDTEQRNRVHSAFMRAALTSGDAGLIAAACEGIREENTDYLKLLLDPATERTVRASLHPIRDLEALQMLEAAIAKRDGKPAPKHTAPPFNHPIDRERLQALGSGQRYRITTDKGIIELDTEPAFAPGSCTAFDSLVAAGYYNGRSFHRVVPDFVAQGGCPRGDGYGAMDWTLRTEAGLPGFETGAVGLASAGKDTESCQFFITLAPAPHLDGRYTRFAHVVSGMEVAQRLVVGDRMITVERVK